MNIPNFVSKFFYAVFIALACALLFIYTNSGEAASDFPIVFVSRNLADGGSIHYPQMGLMPGSGPYSRFSVTGGSLILRESNSSLRTLVDSSMLFDLIRIVDVSDPSVDWDARKILFAGIEHRDSSWRIYEIRSDGTGMRKLTFSNRNISLKQFGKAASKFLQYDDIDPCYLPDGRICFASTRYPSLSFDGYRTTNLYVMNPDGSDMRRITTERNGAEEPSIDPYTGKIIFSRWWYNIDMPSHNTQNGITRDSALALTFDKGNLWWAAAINPDGSGLEMYAGSVLSRKAMHSYKPVVISGNRLLSVFTWNTSMSITSGSSGIRWFSKGAGEPHYIAGVNMLNGLVYNNFPEQWGIMQPPFAADASELPDGRIIYSMAGNVERQDYGIYSADINGNNLQLIIDIPGKMELNAELLVSKRRPPLISDFITYISDELPPVNDPASYFKNGALRFDCGNIFTNADVDVPVPDAPSIIKNARIKLFLNFQRTDINGKDSAILFLDRPIQYSGGFWIPEIPADVPVFDQVTDSSGKVLSAGNRQYAHLSGLNFGRAGTGTQCVGCHSGHSFIPPPQNNFTAMFTNTSTSATVTQSSFRIISNLIQYPGSNAKDRKARNDSLSVNWISLGSDNEWLRLKWDIPIDVQKFVLYNIKTNALTNTNIQVNDCEILMYKNGHIVGTIPSTGALSEDGTSVYVSNYPSIDEAKVVVKNFSGLIEGAHVAGLAEVETIARISYYDITNVKEITVNANDFKLYQNFPNPFNPKTKISFEVPSRSRVNITVYDIAGKQTATLTDGIFDKGMHEAIFDPGVFPDVSSGVYFYRINFNSLNDKKMFFSETKKMIYLK